MTRALTTSTIARSNVFNIRHTHSGPEEQLALVGMRIEGRIHLIQIPEKMKLAQVDDIHVVDLMAVRGVAPWGHSRQVWAPQSHPSGPHNINRATRFGGATISATKRA
jgi:hypothetical protein